MSNLYRLPREFGEKWLAALRSGQYEQTTSAVLFYQKSKYKSYCCLGVGCKVLGFPDSVLEHFTNLTGTVIKDAKYKHLVEAFKREALVQLTYGVRESTLENKVMNMNDAEKKSFKEIADWIEQNVEFYEPVN